MAKKRKATATAAPVDPSAIDEHALTQMQAFSAGTPTTTWHAYRNEALDSAALGDLRFLAVGPDCTLKEAPKSYPDSHLGTGWAYQHCGTVDLATGKVVPSGR